MQQCLFLVVTCSAFLGLSLEERVLIDWIQAMWLIREKLDRSSKRKRELNVSVRVAPVCGNVLQTTVLSVIKLQLSHYHCSHFLLEAFNLFFNHSRQFTIHFLVYYFQDIWLKNATTRLKEGGPPDSSFLFSQNLVQYRFSLIVFTSCIDGAILTKNLEYLYFFIDPLEYIQQFLTRKFLC